MQQAEARAAGALAAQALGAGVARIEELHGAIAARSFGATASPPRAIHDAIAGGVYRAVRGVGGVVTRASGAVLAASRDEDAAPLAASPRAGLALGVLSGAFGDALERDGSPLAVPMALRAGGFDVAPHPAALAAAYPAATGRVALFVHGLCETDASWRSGAERHHGDPRATYPALLERDLGLTPLLLRYNSGLHVSDNGRRLAGLLDAVAGAWPVALDELVLIGHSMGGLVVRSACHHAVEAGMGWPARVRHVVYLGTPHHGAPLEKATALAMHALARIPEARPIARAVNARSVGIKDLRYGTLVEADWCEADPDAWGPDARSAVELLPGARHHAISACIGRTADGALSRIAGDLLVRHASASGSGSGERALAFALDDCCHLDGLTHFDLLNHPAVYAKLRGWLARRELPAA